MTLVVCGDHGTPSPHQDRLESEVVVVPDLCGDPSALARAGVIDTEALILHIEEFDLGFMQGAIRATGADPLGVPIVTLADMPTNEQIDVLAAGVVARHRAFRGARPEHAKMQWPTLISRRRLFALGVPQYIGAPSIDPALCAAERGCRLCVETCPASALEPVSGNIKYNVDTCVACGICVTTCPTGATVNPTATEDQIAAQIQAMVSAAEDPVGIEYRCRDARSGPLEDGWYPVEVPCTGMLTIGWLLAPLVLGAGAVAALSCRTTGCSIENDDLVAGHLTDASSMLVELGISERHLVNRGRGAVPEPLRDVDTPPLANFNDTDVYLALAVIAEISDAVFTSTTGAVGVVTINELACTACERCAGVCPSHALVAHQHEETVEISFDPFLCVGCGMCTSTCPERDRGAITMKQNFDVEELTLGDRIVFSGSMSPCEVCGGPIAPSAMLDRIQSMLGPEHAGTLDLISRRCLNCR
ncbi:MAG: 4Fe-4S binding protein [Actinomycetota bacterium]|nr:4Fe-4S binding protein [Actinomycetota bacterium]